MNGYDPRTGGPGPDPNMAPAPIPLPRGPAPYYGVPIRPEQRTGGLSIASLVLGILSPVLFSVILLTPGLIASGGPLLALLPALCGLSAIVCGICSRKGDEKLTGAAKAGIICGILGLVLGILTFIAVYNGVIRTDFRQQMFRENTPKE